MAIIAGFVLWRLIPLVGLILAIITVIGAIALRLRHGTALGAFAVILFMYTAYESTIWFRWVMSYPDIAHQIELAVLLSVLLSHLATFISIINLMRALRVQTLLEDSISQFELDDLELQAPQDEVEGPVAYVAAPSASPAPAPIFIAAPAYYPQFNDAFMPQAGAVPQFVPMFVDASGKPIAPIHTQ